MVTGPGLGLGIKLNYVGLMDKIENPHKKWDNPIVPIVTRTKLVSSEREQGGGAGSSKRDQEWEYGAFRWGWGAQIGSRERERDH